MIDSQTAHDIRDQLQPLSMIEDLVKVADPELVAGLVARSVREIERILQEREAFK